MKDEDNKKLDQLFDKVDTYAQDVAILKSEMTRSLVLAEDMSSKMDLLVEVIHTLATKEDLAKTNAELIEVKSDVKIIKLALTDTNRDVADHEARITKLETKAA